MGIDLAAEWAPLAYQFFERYAFVWNFGFAHFGDAWAG